jgi:hypothetical protein
MDSDYPTQRESHLEIIRRVLTSRPHQPVAAPYLARITGSLAVHSRIADLRRIGLNIVNHTERVFRDGVLVNTSTYTFIPDPDDGLDDEND